MHKAADRTRDCECVCVCIIFVVKRKMRFRGITLFSAYRQSSRMSEWYRIKLALFTKQTITPKPECNAHCDAHSVVDFGVQSTATVFGCSPSSFVFIFKAKTKFLSKIIESDTRFLIWMQSMHHSHVSITAKEPSKVLLPTTFWCKASNAGEKRKGYLFNFSLRCARAR